jgi:hypothetical protein
MNDLQRSLVASEAMELREPSREELDEAHERLIQTAYLAAVNPQNDADTARDFFAVMRQLISQRSPEQVARMESERGLRTL